MSHAFVPEHGSASYAAGVAVLRLHDLRSNGVAEYVARKQPSDVVVEGRHVGNAAAQNDDVRIDDVDDGCERASQAIFIPAIDAFPITDLRKISLQRRSAEKRFDAA